MTIRPCGADDLPTMFSIINDAARAYRGVIPADCWHDPYMPLDELEKEIVGIDRLALGLPPTTATVLSDTVHAAVVVPPKLKSR